MTIAKYEKISSLLSGNAGEYAVATELSRRGLIASLTSKNTRGIDILAADENALETFAIQVKTNQGYKKEWMLTEKSETMISDNFFYIFVNLGTKTSHPEFHIVPSAEVAKYITETHQQWLSTPGKKGLQRNDNSVRKFPDIEDKYLNNWKALGLRVEN